MTGAREEECSVIVLYAHATQSTEYHTAEMELGSLRSGLEELCLVIRHIIMHDRGRFLMPSYALHAPTALLTSGNQRHGDVSAQISLRMEEAPTQKKFWRAIPQGDHIVRVWAQR